MNPSDFTSYPWSSVARKSEAETIAQNIMVILSRTGNQWRELTWEEYREERTKDGRFTLAEKPYFDQVVEYCASADHATTFSPSWAKVKSPTQ